MAKKYLNKHEKYVYDGKLTFIDSQCYDPKGEWNNVSLWEVGMNHPIRSDRVFFYA